MHKLATLRLIEDEIATRLGLLLTTGTIFYVDANHSFSVNNAQKGKDPDSPLATIDFAIGLCTANKGDIIVVMPNHAETISAAAGIVSDIAGIRVIGIGHGSQMPKVTLDTATTTDIDIEADDVVWENIELVANFADIAHCFDVSAKNFHVVDCKFTDAATNMNFVDYIVTSTTDNECDGLGAVRVEVESPDTGNDAFIAVNGDLDRLTVVDCFVAMGVANGEAIISVATGKDITNHNIGGNKFYRLNTSGNMAVSSDTSANSGMIYDNYVGHADTAGEEPFLCGGSRFFNNYACAVNSASGYLLPTTDS